MRSRLGRRERFMFGPVMMFAIALGGDPVSPSKPTPAATRFDFTRAYQWLFQKRTGAKEKQATPASKEATPDVDLSDARTELRCRNNVFNEPALRASGMTVRVVDGVAYLEGAATSRWLRIRAEQLAGSTPGVARVENHLRLVESTEKAATENTPPMDSLKPATRAPSGLETLASRPKTLASDGGEPVVTTYAIRRPRDKDETLKPASAVTAAPVRPGSGKLVRWDEAEDGPLVPGIPRPAKSPSVDEPVDVEIKRLLGASPKAKGLSYSRNGKEVTLRGAAPPNVMLSIAQAVGMLDGVATVTLEAK